MEEEEERWLKGRRASKSSWSTAMSSPSTLLVASLVEQLSGTMAVSVEKGTAYKIAFMEYFEAGADMVVMGTVFEE